MKKIIILLLILSLIFTFAGCVNPITLLNKDSGSGDVKSKKNKEEKAKDNNKAKDNSNKKKSGKTSFSLPSGNGAVTLWYNV